MTISRAEMRGRRRAQRVARHATILAAERVREPQRRHLMRYAREHLGMTQLELAEAIGIGARTIARAEGGGVVSRGAWLGVVDLCAELGLDLIDERLEAKICGEPK